MGPYKVIHATENTLVIDMDGLHNVVSVNRTPLTRTANEDGLQCGVKEEVTDNDNQQGATPYVGSKREYTRHSCDPESGTRGQRHVPDVDTKSQE